MTEAQDLIKKLNMVAHPEGGQFSESFRDKNNKVSLIYYMLHASKKRMVSLASINKR